MARSTYIYIVRDPDDFPVAAFTVKWELGLWLRQHLEKEWTILRLRDGISPGAPMTIDPADAREVSAT